MLHAVSFRVKPVGKPDAAAPHVRFDERGWETGLYATAPVLDSTIRFFRFKTDKYNAELIRATTC